MNWTAFWFLMWAVQALLLCVSLRLYHKDTRWLCSLLVEADSKITATTSVLKHRDAEIRHLEQRKRDDEERFSRIMDIASGTENESASDFEGC